MKQKPETKPFRFTAERRFGVDRNSGTLTGVALITGGVEAKGHGIFIDEKTISTGAEVLAARSGRLKCSVRHLSWDEYFSKGGDRIEDFPGFFSGCQAKGNQLVADKLEFYDSFKADPESGKFVTRLLEIADKTPDLIGVSLELWGYAVYVAEDGTEYSERPKDVALKYDGLPALRVTDISYGSLVDEPAANPGGLFSRFRFSRDLSDSEVLTLVRRLLADKQTAATDFGPGVPRPAAPASASLVNSSPSSAAPSAPLATATPDNSAMNELINSIKAAFGADKAKFSRAMTILGNNPAITLEALKAEMQQQDFADLQSQVASLSTEKTTLSAKITSLETDKANLTTERDSWKQKFEQLRTSGQLGGDVPTGAPSGGTDLSAGDNPWLPGKENLTRQCELEAKQPALAAQLKAAAKGGAKPAAPAASAPAA